MSIATTIKQRLVGPRQAFGVDITLKQDGNEFHLVELSRKKDSITITKEASYHSFDELLSTVEKGALIGIRLSGKGVLSKKFDSAIPETQLLSQLLPNAKPDDFYVQTNEHNSKTNASIIRKELLIEWVEKFEQYFLVTIELGNESQEVLEQYINYSETEDQEITIGDQKLNKESLPAFSAAFKAILNIDEATLTLTTTSHQHDEYFQKRIFQLAGVTTLGLSLIILLANFILFQNYRTANAEVSQEAAKYMSINATKDSLRTVIDQREDFLAKTGWLSDNIISKQLDAIASIMPSELLLNSMVFNPLDEKLTREFRKNQFTTGVIHIAGETSNTVALNQWVSDINKMKTVTKTDIIKYEYDSRNRVGLFKIAVRTR